MALTWIIRDPKLKVRTELVINGNTEKQDENQYRSLQWDYFLLGYDCMGGGGEREIQKLWVEYVVSVRVKYMGIGCEFV